MNKLECEIRSYYNIVYLTLIEKGIEEDIIKRVGSVCYDYLPGYNTDVLFSIIDMFMNFEDKDINIYISKKIVFDKLMGFQFKSLVLTDYEKSRFLNILIDYAEQSGCLDKVISNITYYMKCNRLRDESKNC